MINHPYYYPPLTKERKDRGARSKWGYPVILSQVQLVALIIDENKPKINSGEASLRLGATGHILLASGNDDKRLAICLPRQGARLHLEAIGQTPSCTQ